MSSKTCWARSAWRRFAFAFFVAAASPSCASAPAVQAPAPALRSGEAPVAERRSAKLNEAKLADVGPPRDRGDSPHERTLRRLLRKPWGSRTDRDEQLVVPLADSKRWRRVTLRPFEFFTGFRYGSQYDALEAIQVEKMAAGSAADSGACLRQTERWALPKLRSFDVHLDDVAVRKLTWQGKPVVARLATARVDYGFKRLEYETAWVAVPTYDEACVVLILAVRKLPDSELAHQVRERWLKESIERIVPLTTAPPVRG